VTARPGGNFLTDLTGGTLPAFSFVTPDLCNDAVVFVAWDEDDGSATNHVPLIVVNPSIRAGTQSGTFFDHYALLKTTEQVLGITTFLGHAGDPGTSSMVSTFNLG
jgi:hypothetical protein